MNDAPARPVRPATALDRLMAAIVVTHIVVAAIHGAAHAGAGVVLNAVQVVFVVIVITAAPICGLYLHLYRPGRLGAAILMASMAASLVFGGVFHFLADTPDNLAHVLHDTGGTWAVAFATSAYTIAGVELVATLVAIGLHRNARSAPRPTR